MKSFHLAGRTSPELAGRFRGLAAHDLENGEYEYLLEPEIAPPGLPHSFDLQGEIWLIGPFPYWVTLQMPDGVIADGILSSITRRVLPAPAPGKDPVWIRFQHAVDHNQVFQVKLGTDGTFRIPAARPLTGSVVVTVCRGGNVLFLDVVHFTRGTPERPLDFRLKPNVIR